MTSTELTKGAIAKFISGVTETNASAKKHDPAPVLLQIVDLKEDRALTPPSFVFMYLWRQITSFFYYGHMNKTNFV